MITENLSRAQQIAVAHGASDKTLMCAGGAIRSGKTHSCTLGFAIWAMAKSEQLDFLITGKSAGSIKRNMANMLNNQLRSFGYKTRYTQSGECMIEANGKRFHILGGENVDSVGRIQGPTFGGALIDEATLVHKEFFNMLMSRLSVRGAKAWATFNPDNPAHWFKKDVLDRIEQWNGDYQHFTLEDNPTLPQEVKDRFKAQFQGHFAKRFLDGLWCAPSGLIFPDWVGIADDELPKPISYDLVIDYGISNTFAALLVNNNGNNQYVVSDELYWDARENRVKSDDELLEDVIEWLGKKRDMLRTTYVDPATPNIFKFKLRGTVGGQVMNADNDVIPGIRVTGNVLKNGELKIADKCRHLREELMGYQWDEKKSDQGLDEPVKKADHACDALRYWAHTTQKYRFGITNRITKPQGM